MIICPNFSNPEVAREFEELKNATSEAAAYHIWSLNNGNAIDKAPNGAQSRLFQTLLEYYKGDRTKAIQAKAKVYGNSFLNWFGDWTGNATYEVYQGRTSEQPDGRRYNYWTLYERDAKTYGPNVRKVRINPSGFLFKREQRWRTNLNGERVFDWDWSEEYERVIEEFKAQTGYDYFDILENGEEGLKKQNKFFEFLESKGYKGYAESNELEQRGGEEHDNPYTVTFGDNGIIDSDVSKVVDENGEPLIVWHTGEKNINIFNTDKVVYDKYGDPLVIPNAIYTTDSFETSISYEEEEQDLIGEYVEGKGIVYADPIFKSQTYPLFVNIKNPRVIDAKGKLWNKIEINGKITTTRKIEDETWQSDYDGVIIKNVIDYGGNPIMPSYMTEQFEPSNVQISFNPNQIKSIDNQGTTPWEGTYSKENDDIYYNLKYLKLNTIDDYKTLFENILRDYYNFHRWHGLRETLSKSTRKINKKDIQKILSWFNLPSGTIYLNEFGTGVKFNDTLLSENLDNLKDLIQDTTPIDIVQAVRVIKMFQQKFPQIKGVKFATSDKWNGKFENGYVYLNPKTFTSVAIEECLHPFVEALFDENPQLFDNLLKQAQKEFKTLRLQIANSYKDKKGFTVEDRQKELVTQALSKHLANIINNKEKQDNIWKKALNWILNKFGLNDISQISEKTTLRELAEQIYTANNINIDDKYFDVQKYNINAKNTPDVVTPLLRQQLTEELQQLNQKHQTLLNNFGLDDKNNPIFVLDKIGEKHGIDIQVKGNVVKSEILFPTDWFVYQLKSNISLDEGTVKSLNEDLDHINYELQSLNAELENGSWYSEEIGEWFKFDESSKQFKRDRIQQLLKDKKHIESQLEKYNTQQNVVQNKISEYRQLLYNLLFYLHSIGLNTVKSTDFFNSQSPLDLYIENYDQPIISEIVNNIQYLVGKEALNKYFSINTSDDYDYILVNVEGLLEHVKQNYEVSVKNSIISDIKDVISGKYRRTAEDRQIFEQEVEKILSQKQELQNQLDDLQKTEREQNLKDYLKSLRKTLDC